MRISGGKNLSLLQIASTKLYCYHSVIINVIEINRNQSLIVLQKYGSMYIVCSQSYIALTKTKNLYSQINHTLQWYREATYKNTTQHIHDK
jgi:hypothetical protein